MVIFNYLYILISVFILVLFYGGYDLGAIRWFYLAVSMALVYDLIKSYSIYSVILQLNFVVLFLFFNDVYMNRDNVALSPVFDFSVFTEANLRQAMIVVIFTGIFSRLPHLLKHERVDSNQIRMAVINMLKAINRASSNYFNIMIFGSIILGMLFFFTNATLLDYSYPSHIADQWVIGDFFKVPTFLSFFGLVLAHAWQFSSNPLYKNRIVFARICFILIAYMMFLLTGNRGFVTFLTFLAMAIECLSFYRFRKGFFWAIVFFVIAMIYFKVGPYLRVNLSTSVSKNPITLVFEYMSLPDETTNVIVGAYDMEKIPLLGQSLFHLLYTIDLIENGISLGGSTFVNLIPQFLPEYLDGILWTRPLNDNWLLSFQMAHQGGFLHLANAYWNGGLWVCALYGLVLSFLFSRIDSHLVSIKSSSIYYLVYIFYIPSLIVQLGYGIQGIARIVEALFIIMLYDSIVHSRRQKSL